MLKRIEVIRALAEKVGYRVEHAVAKNKWRLVNKQTGEAALGPRGTPSFSKRDAIRFLRRLAD